MRIQQRPIIGWEPKVETPKYREPPIEGVGYFVDHDGKLKRCFTDPQMIVKEWRAKV